MTERRAYITYFDQRYAARGIVMLASLIEHDPDALIFPLCFDAMTREIVDSLEQRQIRTLTPEDLHAFEPRLLAVQDRPAWAFYGTHKPVLPLYVLEQAPDVGSVTHVDSDCRFYRSPHEMFEKLEGASIGLSPHAFSDLVRPYLAKFGTYNAGLIFWRNDAAARNCLENYREQCLEWCAPRALPDGRFMNQGYLNAWPEKFDGVRLIDDPATNVGYWNAADRAFSEQDGQVRVNGSPLTLFHFAGVARNEAGEWDPRHPGYADNWDFIWDNLLGPYLDEVDDSQARLDRRWPDLSKAALDKG